MRQLLSATSRGFSLSMRLARLLEPPLLLVEIDVGQQRQTFERRCDRRRPLVELAGVFAKQRIMVSGVVGLPGDLDIPLFPQIPLDAYGRRNGVSSPISKWLRNVVGIKDPRKPFHSHRHTATSYLRNTRLPDGEYAVKTDIERYLLGHSEKDSHAGYGKQWIETLKAAIEIIPNPLQAPLRTVKDGASAGS